MEVKHVGRSKRKASKVKVTRLVDGELVSEIVAAGHFQRPAAKARRRKPVAASPEVRAARRAAWELDEALRRRLDRG